MHTAKSKVQEYIAKRGKDTLSGLISEFPEMQGRVILVDGCDEPDAKKREQKIANFLKTSAQLTGNIDYFQEKLALFEQKLEDAPETVNKYKALSWRPEDAPTRHAIIAPEEDKVPNAAHMHAWLDQRNYKSLHNVDGKFDLSHIDVHIERIINHEFAHTVAIAMGEKFNIHQHEMVADAFSTMRHKKKYGLETPMVTEMADQRAMGLLRGDVLHHTTDVINQVEAKAKEQPHIFMSMSAKEMMDVAIDMAKDAGRISADEELEMASIYRDIGAKDIKTQSEEIVSDLLAVRRSTQSKFIKQGATHILEAVGRRSSHAPEKLKQRMQKTLPPKS